MMKLPVGIYALLLIVGGIMGYVMKGSIASLLMGGFSGLIFAILAFQQGKIVDCFTLILTALLGGFFGYRFYETHKIFPSAFMALVSLFLLMWLVRDCFSSACCKSDTNKLQK